MEISGSASSQPALALVSQEVSKTEQVKAISQQISQEQATQVLESSESSSAKSSGNSLDTYA